MNTIKIALVEDNKCDLEIITEVLKKGGTDLEIQNYGSVQDFISAWDTSSDIIISEHQLRDGTSFDIINHLENAESKSPIIILSNVLEDKDIAKLITEFKVNDIILKKDIHRLNQTVLKEFHASKSFIELEQKNEDLKKLSLIAKQTTSGVVLTDVNGVIVWVNQAFTKMSGYSQEESIGRKPGDFLHGPDTDIQTKKRISTSLKLKKIIKEEILNYRKDDSTYWLGLEISPVFENGEHTGFVSTQEDITKRKKTERALSDAYERLLTAQKAGKIGDWHFDLETKSITWSEELFNIYDREPALGVPSYEELVFQYTHDKKEEFHNLVQQAITKGIPYEVNAQIKTDKGRIKDVIAIGIPSKNEKGEITALFGTAQDVTRRMEALRKTKENEERLKKAQKAGKIGDWYLNLTTHDVFWSDEMYSIYDREPELGIPPVEEVIRKINIEDPKGVEDTFREGIKTGNPYEITRRIKSYKGIIKDIHTIGIPETNETGQVISVRGTTQDVTNRMEAIRKIRESEVRLDSAIKGADLAVWDLNLETGMNSVNSRYYQMLGYEPFEFEVELATFKSLVHPNDIEILNDATESLSNGDNEYDINIRLKHKDETYRIIRNRAIVVERDKNNIPTRIIGTHLDITNETKLKQDLTTSLSEKSTLLQEIHHRVKNNLAVIIGLLHLQSFKSNNAELSVFYDEMSNRIKSIADVHELLYSSETLSKINLNTYIKKLFHNVLSVSNNERTPKQLIHIDSDFEMNINQAIPLGLLMNELLINSVKHAFKETSDPSISFTVLQEGESIRIIYKDNGVGFKVAEGKSPSSLGFTLITTLLSQLDSKYSFLNTIGFGIEFSFPLMEHGSHSYLKT